MDHPSCRFALSSSTGSETVTWDVREREEGTCGTAITCDVTLAGSYFEGLFASGGREPDFRLVLRELRLSVRDLERLVDPIDAWLADVSPGRPPIALVCSMGGLFDQSLLLELGPRDDTLSGGRPVARLRYVVGRMTGEMIFPTDSSCLSCFVDGIRTSALRAPQELP
jgi:hypothetical protein